jgi:transposase-like protein
MDRNSLELLLGQGLSMEEIARRFGKNPSTVAYWVRKHGLARANGENYLARGGIERERFEALIDAGMTIAEIAAAVGLSNTATRRWLRRYDLRTVAAQRVIEQRRAKDAGLTETELSCPIHGHTDHVLSGDGYYRCRKCHVESVVRRRRKVKELLVQEAGGRCSVCGYDRYIGALEFHHVDPDDKRLSLGGGGVTLAIEVLRDEAQKCVLLCSNCHAEVEGGVTMLPARVAA